ncbi:MAG: FtsX-like permease family protein [Eubacteriales bacterium]|nr:FtsX-like permease family protein [Eubacteriales bacterium]
MFQLVLRKIFSNSWKVLSLLLGSILVVGMVCSIPIYSNAILQRLLTRDLEQAQTGNSRYPGYLAITSNYSYVSVNQANQLIEQLEKESQSLFARMPVEADVTASLYQAGNLYHISRENDETKRNPLKIGFQTGLTDHIEIVRGRMYEPGVQNDTIEVIVSDLALENANMMLDRDYVIHSYRQGRDNPEALLKVRVVGVYAAAELQNIYWYHSINMFSDTLIMDEVNLRQLVAEKEEIIWSDHVIFAGYDYYSFRIQNVDELVAVNKTGQALGAEYARTTRFSSTFHTVVENYVQREAELKLTLQILIVPILLMLVFYIFMVSQLMVRSETHMISVLESRGAGRHQTLMLYALESLLLGGVTLVAGPLLGLWMVRVIGASNGFLEFVDRAALKASIDRQAVVYAVVAVLLFMLTTQLPVFIEARKSIVEQKRRKSRALRAPLWQRIFLDILLAGVSLYALSRMRAQLEIQKMTGTAGTELNLDFLLFLASTMFILGFGLFFLRLYPYLLRLVYWLGQRFWNPVMYASFHQIGRSNGQEQFLMIFLILALSIGLFNANAARTINSNTEDTIRSETGADIVIREYWQPYSADGLPIIDGASSPQPAGTAQSDVIKYVEPDIRKYSGLDGVEHATRVYRSDETRISQGGVRSDPLELMAIDPYDFAQTAWWRQDILSHHLYDYMNVMISMPNGVILSSDLRDSLDLAVGDAVIYTVNGQDTADGVIVAFTDYWPGYQPLIYDTRGNLTKNSLIVASLDYVLSRTAMQPYDVWLKRDAAATDVMIYENIEEKKINIFSIDSANQAITKAKNDPQLQGTNGALTLGFIVSMLVCAIGFLIYWIMLVQGRVLQFGIFRAMGLGKSSVIGMLIAEQGLVSGVAILFGVLLGHLASRLYVPLFQMVYSSADQPIPFRIISDPNDSLKVYIVLGFLLLICIGILIRLILNIRIDQAVKLGED